MRDNKKRGWQLRLAKLWCSSVRLRLSLSFLSTVFACVVRPVTQQGTHADSSIRFRSTPSGTYWRRRWLWNSNHGSGLCAKFLILTGISQIRIKDPTAATCIHGHCSRRKKYGNFHMHGSLTGESIWFLKRSYQHKSPEYIKPKPRLTKLIWPWHKKRQGKE